MAFPGMAGLTEAPVDVGEVAAALADAALGRAGALVAFTGLVRSDPLPAGTVQALDFEVYPEMAGAVLERIREEACRRHGLAGCSLLHRIGVVPVGGVVVVVAVAAPHRRAAFEAAAWVMDEVKARVPVWKRAVDASGGRHWVEPRESGR